ncbi:MAG TPA: porin [Xanthobacteraceae bacterium]|jgi:hypothetical protein
MKMVKSLLLGSAAGLVAVTAGQAADLPVKAKPVEYVKVCSLYGAGFYYMPGTDLCLKIGGWVRAEATWGGNGSMTWGPFNNNVNNRTTSNLVVRARGYITADAREQTAYGTARGYIAVGINTSDVGTSVGTSAGSALTFNSNRAFVQFAGMTAGLATSFFDYYSVPAAEYRGGYLPASDTGDGGWWVWAYTAQLGNGVSATISAEQRRLTQIINQGTGAVVAANGTIVPGAFAGGTALSPAFGAYGGWQVPDIVGNVRVDQAWGGAQVMGALHEVNANYFAGPVIGAPTNKWGFAVGAGLRVNTPFITQGDYFQSQFNYSQGALRYLFNTPNTNWGKVDGNTQTFGVLSDCVYGGTLAGGDTTNCQLTTAWGFNASYEHYWTPQLHQSVYGAYYKVNYDTLANSMLCELAGGAQGTGVGSAAIAAAGCSNNWSTWGAGTRLQYDVTKTFYIGVEAMYVTMNGGTTSDGLLHGFGTTSTAGNPVFVENRSNDWNFTVRMHKDFLP